MLVERPPLDPALYRDNPDAQAELVGYALLLGDSGYLARSLWAVAQAQGAAEVARRAGVGVDALEARLARSDDPPISVVLRVLKALNLRLEVRRSSPESMTVDYL